VSRSDDRIVTLLNVDRRSTGIFKCEVSADAPLFHTEIQSAVLRVVGKSNNFQRIREIGMSWGRF
jgi:hypothetical protein